jgi:hypothetical protein
MYNPVYKETKCDNPSCNKLLQGYDRTTHVQTDHLTIRGGICTQRYTENGKPFFTYLTERPQEGQRETVYAFCNSRCLSGFIESREAYMQELRKRERQEWAMNETKGYNRFDNENKYG